MNSQLAAFRHGVLVAVALLALIAVSASVRSEEARVGTWQLVKRELPDGTVLMPPDIGGLSSINAAGLYHNNVFWTSPGGKPGTVSNIITFKFSESELTATRHFGFRDLGDGSPAVYATPGETSTVPVERDGNRMSYQHPFDQPFIEIDGDTTTATLKDVFVDTWVRTK